MKRCVMVALLVLAGSGSALAQVRGEVESIGFNNYYRPDAWTPMLVRIVPETARSDTYQIHVIQEDLDRDRVVYVRTISVTGAIDGPGGDQRFWVYFIPQPTGGGLPDPQSPAALRELQERLKVFVTTAAGRQIVQLPITSTIINIDPIVAGWGGRERGRKLIVCVSDGRSQPVWAEYQQAVGLVEEPVMVTVRPRDLPENVLGYDAVDAIVWLNTDPGDINLVADDKLPAIREYVRQGGRLIICQPSERDKTNVFGDLMPVDVITMEEVSGIHPLWTLAGLRTPVPPGPFRVGRAQAKQGAVVAEWIDWAAAGAWGEPSPYLARTPYGLGSVSWVAQDLGDPGLSVRARRGWPHVWDKVFDWRNDTLVPDPTVPEHEQIQAMYAPGQHSVDFGRSMLRDMELRGRSAALMFLAVVFFIFYWVVAGPGIYFYLANRRRSGLSWFIFAASALVATAITVLVVQLVLRGPPQLRHITVVRAAAGEPAVVHSRMGLYIPRDGVQQITLDATDPGSVSTLTPFPMHPQYLHLSGEAQFPAYMEYRIPVRDATSDDPVSLAVPYRSTLKKLQTRWVGQVEGRITGEASVVAPRDGYISGRLTNGTGRDLRNIYIAFNHPTRNLDWVLYLPAWGEGVTLDLQREFNTAPFIAGENTPERGRKVRGMIAPPGRELIWDVHWYTPLRRTGFGDDPGDDSGQAVRRSFPMMSLFDRLPPPRRLRDNVNRFEMLRRGGRHLDLSHIISAGGLVVLAEADGPLPFPLHVHGDTIEGEGLTYYQFVLPLARGEFEEDEPLEAEEERMLEAPPPEPPTPEDLLEVTPWQ